MNKKSITFQGHVEKKSTHEQFVQARHIHLWLAMSSAEKAAQGGVKGFARQHQLNVLGLNRFLNKSGLTFLGMQRISKHTITSCSVRHLEEWQKLTHQQRFDCGGVNGFAYTQQIYIGQFNKLANLQGLSERGRQFLTASTSPVTDAHLDLWLSMSIEQRLQIGQVTGFSLKHKINLNDLQKYANMEGLTALGIQRLQPTKLKPVANSHLTEWLNMTSVKRKKIGGTAGYALDKKILLKTFRTFANDRGLRFLGLQRLFPQISSSVEGRHLEEWRSMDDAQKKAAGGVTGFAMTHQISLGVWRNYAVSTGLNLKGEMRLQRLKSADQSKSMLTEPVTLLPEKVDVATALA